MVNRKHPSTSLRVLCIALNVVRCTKNLSPRKSTRELGTRKVDRLLERAEDFAFDYVASEKSDICNTKDGSPTLKQIVMNKETPTDVRLWCH